MRQVDLEMIERHAGCLTKAQRGIWDKMRCEGCFIVLLKGEYCAKLVRPDLTVVQKVYMQTLSRLSPTFVRETLLGDDGIVVGYHGRIYVAHEPLHLCGILRSYEACAKACGFVCGKRRSK